jgi:hypothetical protein
VELKSNPLLLIYRFSLSLSPKLLFLYSKTLLRKFARVFLLLSSAVIFFVSFNLFCLILRKDYREMTGAKECESVTLDLLKKKMTEFAKERDWQQFHSPRNLLLALVSLQASTISLSLLVSRVIPPSLGLFLFIDLFFPVIHKQVGSQRNQINFFFFCFCFSFTCLWGFEDLTKQIQLMKL